jgi:hypothetical protein
MLSMSNKAGSRAAAVVVKVTAAVVVVKVTVVVVDQHR